MANENDMFFYVYCQSVYPLLGVLDFCSFFYGGIPYIWHKCHLFISISDDTIS